MDTYNADGSLVSEIDPLGNTTNYAYNPLGLPQQQSANGGPQLGPTYDKAGNVVADTDLQNGEVTNYTYNPMGQVVETEQPAPATGDPRPITTETYDADRDLLSQTDPLGNTTAFSYDCFGNQISQKDPLGNTTSYTYDLDADELSTADPMGNVTAYSYDAFGNQVSQSLPDPTTGKQDGNNPTTTYSFDAMGDEPLA